jgi:hypothetical protein
MKCLGGKGPGVPSPLPSPPRVHLPLKSPSFPASSRRAPLPQARGRALLNMRLTDAEGGLLGRTLLTLVANKGFGGPVATPLPPHKLSPHDVVALRPNSQPQGAGGPPLCSGLVYRVKETAIVVAVDDMPEDGLEQPLRVEKLANEVGVQRRGRKEGRPGRAGALQPLRPEAPRHSLRGQRPRRRAPAAGDVQAPAQHAAAAVGAADR